jgi:hypothetical protein
VIGVAAFEVFTMSKEPSAFLTNQVQLEPKLLTALSLNLAWNSAKDPNAALIASAIAPVGSPPPFGLRLFQ